MKYTLALILLLMPSVAWSHDGVYLCDHEVLPDQIEDPKNCHLYNPEKDKNPDFKKWHFNFLINSEGTSWHLLTVSHSGTVSLVKGLSKGECDRAKNDAPIKWESGIHQIPNSDIDRAECFQ